MAAIGNWHNIHLYYRYDRGSLSLLSPEPTLRPVFNVTIPGNSTRPTLDTLSIDVQSLIRRAMKVSLILTMLQSLAKYSMFTFHSPWQLLFSPFFSCSFLCGLSPSVIFRHVESLLFILTPTPLSQHSSNWLRRAQSCSGCYGDFHFSKQCENPKQ